jgi:probable rRNA maturation factor
VTLAVAVQFGTRRPWVPPKTRLIEWARMAAGARARSRELAIRVVTPAESRRLNRHYRGKDRPTNVLSFPAGAAAAAPAPTPLGDLAICAGVVAREARAQHKTLAAHWAHMVVHGTLHLIGYDHAAGEDARRMEQRERAVLARLGFPDPYRAGGDG